MINNDVLRRIRYALDLSDQQLQHLIKRGLKLTSNGSLKALSEIDQEQVLCWLKKESDENYNECPDVVLNGFLDGLVEHLRGKSDKIPPPLAGKLSNNLVMRKLKIALALRSEAMVADILRGGGQITQSELSALFRKPDHRNYKVCGDQLLRRFLHGLVLRLRPDMPSPTQSSAQRAQPASQPPVVGAAAYGHTQATAKPVKGNQRVAAQAEARHQPENRWPATSATAARKTSVWPSREPNSDSESAQPVSEQSAAALAQRSAGSAGSAESASTGRGASERTRPPGKLSLPDSTPRRRAKKRRR